VADRRSQGDGDVNAQTTTVADVGYIPPVRRSVLVKKTVLYALLIALSLLFFVPFIWSIATSFKTIPDSINVNLIPHPWTTSAWRAIWTQYDFKLYIRNSFFLAVVITVANILLAGLGGYAFARLRFPGRDALFIVVLGTLMVPDQLRLIPVFVMLTNWHLIQSFDGYILINLVTATNLFFMRQYFLTIPTDFEEAAKLDGAGYFKTFWRVMLPLALPAIAALTILQFQGTWNDFFWPLILFGQGNAHLYTVQLGLALLNFNYTTLWPQIMAGSILAILPILVVFVIFQRYFVSGLVTPGVKG
jgi:multiple sugar transport system permease protein